MEHSYELRLVDIRKTLLEQSQPIELYIPLHGKHTTNPDEEPFDLAQKVKEFFVFDDNNPSDPRVMLLMGDTGSGKSMFAQKLFQQLLQQRKKGDPIPIWIPLPELQRPFENAVEEVLRKQEHSEAQISKMKRKERFIFIVDGYDELHQFQNCYVTNGWEKWKAKVLITCRSQALYYQKDPDKYFMPFNGEKRLPWLLRKLYVAAFSHDQISAYIEQYNKLQRQETTIKLEDLDKISGLEDLITTPFLLHLTVEALPDILANVGVEEENSKMTQAKLYDVFIERWFTRQVKKLQATEQLKESEDITKQQFWDYCKKLAQQMHAKEVSIVPFTQSKAGGRLFGKQEKRNIWEKFFNSETEVLRSACPLKKMGDHHYGFIHASFVEYFATRAMYEEIQVEGKGEVTIEDQDNEHKEKVDMNEILEEINPRKPKGGIHERIFAKERQAIQFIADRIEMNNNFKQKMLNLVETSKTNEFYATGAANAITGLVKAGVSFNDANLSRVKISGSDLTGGYFARVNFEGSDLRDVALVRAYLWQGNLRHCQLSGVTFGEYPWFQHDHPIQSLDYREDLNQLVTGTEGSITDRWDIVIWDIRTEKRLKVLSGHTLTVSSAEFSVDGQQVVSGSHDWSIRVWDVNNGESRVLRREDDYDIVTSVHFSSDGQKVVSGSRDKTVRVWDVATAWEKVLWGHEGEVESVHFSKDSQKVVSGSADKTVRVWDVASSRLLVVLRGHEEGVNCVQFCIDDCRVVSGSNDKTVRVWNMTSGEAKVLQGHQSSVCSVQFSKDGQRVVSGSWDMTVRVWDVDSGHVRVLRGHHNFVSSVQFSMDDQRVISGSWDKTVRVWDVSSGQEKNFHEVQENESRVNSVHVSADGHWVVSGSSDKTVRVWNVASGENTVLRGHESSVNSVQCSSDGRRVVSGSSDNTVRVWDVGNGHATVLQGHSSSVMSVQWSSDEKRVMSGSDDRYIKGSIRIWDLASGSKRMLMHKSNNGLIQFSADDRRVVSVGTYDEKIGGYTGYTILVWEENTGEEKELRGHQHTICSVQFSPDGQRVVSGSMDMTVRVWEVASGQAMVLRGHENWVESVQFTWDGQRVVSGSYDKTIRVWDIEKGQMIYCLKLHSPVRTFCLHDRSGLLCVGFDDGMVQCWQLIKNDWQSLRLKWSSSLHSPALVLSGCDLSDVIGLSSQHERLVIQRDAITANLEEINSQPVSTELLSTVAQRTGSPLHQVSKMGENLLDHEDKEPNEKSPRIHSSQVGAQQEDDAETAEREDGQIETKKKRHCVIF